MRWLGATRPVYRYSTPRELLINCASLLTPGALGTRVRGRGVDDVGRQGLHDAVNRGSCSRCSVLSHMLEAVDLSIARAAAILRFTSRDTWLRRSRRPLSAERLLFPRSADPALGIDPCMPLC
jgi:hypothetical protein